MSEKNEVHWYACPYCESEKVQRDAIVEWDKNAQAWTIVSVLDSAHCEGCGTEDILPEEYSAQTQAEPHQDQDRTALDVRTAQDAASDCMLKIASLIPDDDDSYDFDLGVRAGLEAAVLAMTGRVSNDVLIETVENMLNKLR